MISSQCNDCIFCSINSGLERSWPIWDDEKHLAVLTPFPNTPGFAVVMTRTHLPSDIFMLEDAEFQGLLRAARTVSHLMNHALETRRVALIAEGMGVDHAHIKLVPLHGLPKGSWKAQIASAHAWTPQYEGYITSLEGPPAADAELQEMAMKFHAFHKRRSQ